ncbi:MAG: cyanophycinase [Anaerolineae bacterium]|nr:cyanophycinase [Anaerolineae bacterium]
MTEPTRRPQRGYLMPIGGAEDRRERRAVLNHFVKLSGGNNARIVVIPSASAFSAELGPEYMRIFSELGAGEVKFADIQERTQANDPDCVSMFENASAIYFSGGDQLKLVALLGGTLLLKKMHERYERGAVIAGTSAGASAISQHMIAFGRPGASPSLRMVQLSAGLGFTDKCVIDQHFRERDRIGRLVSALAHNPSLLGVGVDEDTALIIGPRDDCEVVGAGSVTIVDGSGIEYTDIYDIARYNAISVFGVKLHFLTEGHRYNLRTRIPKPPKKRRNGMPLS